LQVHQVALVVPEAPVGKADKEGPEEQVDPQGPKQLSLFNHSLL